MRKENGQLIYAPSDLVRFMASPFSGWMERYSLEFPGELAKDEQTEEQKLIAAKGDEHETRYLQHLRQEGIEVTEIPKHTVEHAIAMTREAIAEGRPCIYQACLSRPPFQGFADFLVRVAGDAAASSRYEVWDTKLALSVKPYYLVQLCCYAEMLAGEQEGLPEHIVVVLGDRTRQRRRTSDFYYHYLEVRKAFLKQMEAFDPDARPVPEPRADHGLWTSHAEKYLLEQDHLVQVAGILKSQIRKIEAAGIRTMKQLASAEGVPIPRLAPAIKEKLVRQAALQVRTRELRATKGEDQRPAYEILPPDGDGLPRAFQCLPPASPLDVCFDMEGYPLVDGGLEYLFGAVHKHGGGLQFKDWWAYDAATEKEAFEGFIDWVVDRRRRDPSMHVYHYASYEASAMRRLMGRHGTREVEVDDLLRGGVFVDLYKVVRQGLRIGEDSYSIKSIETLYRPKRAGDVKAAGESVVYFARWLQSGEPRNWQDSGLLRSIRDYNEDDCVSTWQLLEWLRARQTENGIAYVLPPELPAREERAEGASGVLPPDVVAQMELADELLSSLPAEEESRRLQELLAHLLCFHYRELKPAYWKMYELLGLDFEELYDDPACLAGIVLQSTAGVPEKQSLLFEYKFDPDQETKIGKGSQNISLIQHPKVPVAVHAFDPNGRLQLKISKKALQLMKNGPPQSSTLIAVDKAKSDILAAAIFELVTQWKHGRPLSPALRRFLDRQPPELQGHTPGRPLLAPDEALGDGAVRIATAMADSVLCIQGPPGTGKTTVGARMIAALMPTHNVGVTSNSHKAQFNLLRKVAEQVGPGFKCVKAGGDEDDPLFKDHPGATRKDNTAAASGYAGGLIAGTAWLFARQPMAGKLDYLFVDEAGQVSVANLVAMSRCTRNIVLLGDQMQLDQPIQGSHPGESGMSALSYYLQDHATIPEDLGLFLGLSYRMHPALCAVVSEMVYEGRLKSAPEAGQRRIEPANGATHLTRGTGVLFSPVEHAGNTQGSDEEVERINALIDDLLASKLRTPTGVRKLKLDDILLVAPYNLQVRKLQHALPEAARVGSVDKFQGQEAPVVIVSMCSSAGEYGSRGLSFLLDRNRLNVAISRAQCLAIVVGDPRIASGTCTTIPDMERLNFFSKLLDAGLKDSYETH